MDEPTMPGGEEPQTIETPASPPSHEGTPPAKTLDDISLGDFTPEQLEILESGDAGKISEVLGLPKEPEKPVQPKIEQPAQDHGPDRISLKAVSNREERLAMARATQMVRDGKHTSLKDALVEAFEIQAKAASSPEAPNQEPVATPQEAPAQGFKDPEVERIGAEIAEVSRGLKEARTVLFDAEKEQELLEKLIDLKADLKMAQREAAAKQSEAAGFEKLENESRERVLSRFSELFTDPESEFQDLLEVEITLAERKNDPILSKPDWPEQIASRTIKRHNISVPGEQIPGGQDASHLPAKPVQQVRLPGAPIGRDATPAALSVNNALAELEKMSPEERMAVLSAADAKIHR